MKDTTIQQITKDYPQYKEEKLFGRYITFDKIAPLLQQLPSSFGTTQLGQSFQKRPIYKITMGTGCTKVLLWSQMHGNESTGTKALFDLFRFFANPKKYAIMVENILSQCTLVCIPMLNPDGAAAYTRENAQKIDLNRDAVALKAVESNILRAVLKEYLPQFCFNLHDQRTIFSVGSDALPATLSFLAPSESEDRAVTDGRKITMSVIAAMNSVLQTIIPNQIGRYTDEFYPTATGDNFQKAGHHTILIEAGHCKGDYTREKVRSYNFIALLAGLQHIATGKFNNYKTYFDIPNNRKFYLDVLYKNVFFSESNKTADIGIVYKETLKGKKVVFIPTLNDANELHAYNANTIIDKKGAIYDNKESFFKTIEK